MKKLFKTLQVLLMLFEDIVAPAQTKWSYFNQEPIFRQSSPMFVYKIPIDSVLTTVYKNVIPAPTTPWLQTPLKIYKDHERYIPMDDSIFTAGYYLMVWLDKNRVNFEFRRKAGFTETYADIACLRVLELKKPDNSILDNAEVRLNSRTISYNKQMHGYVLDNYANNDTLTISKGEDMNIVNCSVVQQDYYAGNENQQYNTIRANDYKGYLVTNKPKYLPQDTVKWKGYLLDPQSGQPLNEPVKVSLLPYDQYYGQYYNMQARNEQARHKKEQKHTHRHKNKKHRSQDEDEDDDEDEDVQNDEEYGADYGRQMQNEEIVIANAEKPSKPGVYFNEFVISDSMKMGTQYFLILSGLKSGHSIIQRFNTEDYLLQDLKLKIKGEAYDKYQYGDTARYYVYASTANNLPLMDGKMTVTVTKNYYRDTVYREIMQLNPNGETLINFPVPNSSTNDQCILRVENSNGDKRDTAFNVPYTQRPYYIHVSKKGNIIMAELIQNKKSIKGEGSVRINAQKPDAISYPCELKTEGYYQSMVFNIDTPKGNIADAHYCNMFADSLQGDDVFIKDTAFLEVSNKQRSYVRYSIFKEDQAIGYGSFEGDTTFKVYSPGGKTITVNLNYTWQNDNRTRHFAIYKYDKNMQIDVQKKDLVYPGQRDSISISLSDINGKPIKHTNLTVFAFNNQFTEDHTPSLSYGGKLRPGMKAEALRNFNNYPITDTRWTILTDTNWIKVTGADSNYFYKYIMLDPRDNVWVQYPVNDNPAAQMGVFVHTNGIFYEPEMIYVDSRPVYFRQAKASTNASSLLLSEGSHEIKVRMADALYTITAVPAEAGKKINLFINTALTSTYQMRKDSMPGKLQYQETEALAGSMLMYRTEYSNNSRNSYDNYYASTVILQQYPADITLRSRVGEVSLCGPFNFKDSISFYQYGNVKMHFMPEANYIFTLRPGMTRVEQQNVKSYLNNITLYNSEYWPNFGQTTKFSVSTDSLLVSIPADYVQVAYRKIAASKKAAKGQVIIEGKVLTEDGKPISKAYVSWGYHRGYTDSMGKFSLIAEGHQANDLYVQCNGYTAQYVHNIEIRDGEKAIVSIKMAAIWRSMGLAQTNETSASREATVVSYKLPLIQMGHPQGVMDARDIKHSGITNTADLVAVASPGIHISRSGGELNAFGGRGNATQFIIDGEVVNGAEGRLPEGMLNIQESTGKDMIRANKTQAFINNFLSNMPAAAGMRKTFRDYAIWEPNLWTDKNGYTSFNVTYPDNITGWKTYVLAMNEKGFSGQVLKLTQAFKPLSAQLAAPRFLLYGDSVTAIGKISNYTAKPFKLHTVFKQYGKDAVEDTATVHNIRVVYLPLSAPVKNEYDTSILNTGFGIRTDEQYNDGEEKNIPVFPAGVTENRGDYIPLKKDSTVYSQPSRSAHFAGETYIYADGSALELMLRDIEDIKEFPYGCVEQLTTKLLAISYEEQVKHILNIKHLNNAGARNAIIEKLMAAQKTDGSFTWWNYGGYDIHITNYVLGTMTKINSDHSLDGIMEGGLRFLANNLDKMGNREMLTALDILSCNKYSMDYKKYMDKVNDSTASTHEKFLFVKIAQDRGLPYKKTLDSLVKDTIADANGLHWAYRGYRWYDNDVATTALAYSVISNDSNYRELLPGIKEYLLSRRTSGYGRNTAESGQILLALLPDMLKSADTADKNKKPRLLIAGSLNDTVKQFPKVFKVKNADPHFSFQQKGIFPLYVTVVYKYFNAQPATDSNSIFRVKNMFLKGRDTLKTLKQGDKIILRTIVTCDTSAEYVMVEVPIPAGCVQINKPGNYQNGFLNSREDFKEKTVFFCNTLDKGTYYFDVELDARYKGSFSINPAKAAMMYYPDKYGNTAVNHVVIK